MCGGVIDIISARGKLAVFPQIKNGELFDELKVDGLPLNYTPTFYIGENLGELIAYYATLFEGELLYVLGLELNGERKYFNTSFLFSTGSNLYGYSVAGLEESNVAYKGFSFKSFQVIRTIVVPNNSFVLSLGDDTALSLRYEFGEEEIYKLESFNLIAKKPIGYTIIPSLPKVALPQKDILELSFI